MRQSIDCAEGSTNYLIQMSCGISCWFLESRRAICYGIDMKGVFSEDHRAHQLQSHNIGDDFRVTCVLQSPTPLITPSPQRYALELSRHPEETPRTFLVLYMLTAGTKVGLYSEGSCGNENISRSTGEVSERMALRVRNSSTLIR